MKMTTMLLAGLCGVAPALCAQQVASPAVRLKATIVGETPLDRPTALNSAACDGAGNVYTQRMPGPEDSRPPIQEITTEAKLGATFQLPLGYPGDGGAGFVNRDGVVYMAVHTRSGVYVEEFAPDGSVRAKTKLEADSYVQPLLLAVFKSGEYLLAGLTGTGLHTPFTAVFARDGRMVKKIYEPEDEEARQQAEAGGWKFVMLGDVSAGTDGNVYLLHSGSHPLVYAVSSAGDVIRKLRIETGHPDLTARSIKFHGGRLAIGFDVLAESGKQLIKVVDTQGNPIGEYGVGDREINRLALACYDSKGFTLVSESGESKLSLFRAKLP